MSPVEQKRLSAIFGKTVEEGEAIHRTIQEAADDLAFLMGQLHGEAFHAHVSHEPAFALIRYRDMGGAA